MKKSFSEKNVERNHEKKKRHREIHIILEQQNITTHDEIVKELSKRNIVTSQSTVYRDLEELGIRRNANRVYKPSEEIQKKFHIDALYDLLMANDSLVCDNVVTYFINTKKGKAQEIAFHLEEAFNNIVLKTIIGLDNVVIFADGNEITDEFHSIFVGQEE
ncbi:hypothetical protein ACP3VS_13270 [Lysinibacillus sp. VIII_CA]|uniref:hypothetical protein n=1 Tax=Lysinibacillus sp. VIII_CA TaxID=3417452 RepID=UPI003CF23DA2